MRVAFIASRQAEEQILTVINYANGEFVIETVAKRDKEPLQKVCQLSVSSIY